MKNETYRVYKLDRPEGQIVKAKDVVKPNDDAALEDAISDPDCPDCEVWQGARKVGSA